MYETRSTSQKLLPKLMLERQTKVITNPNQDSIHNIKAGNSMIYAHKRVLMTYFAALICALRNLGSSAIAIVQSPIASLTL